MTEYGDFVNIDNMEIGNNTSFIDKIMTEAAENYDEFVFRTIQPFCENVMEMKIPKEELIEALRMYKKQVLCRDCKHYHVDHFAFCDKDNRPDGPLWYCKDGERKEDEQRADGD